MASADPGTGMLKVLFLITAQKSLGGFGCAQEEAENPETPESCGRALLE